MNAIAEPVCQVPRVSAWQLSDADEQAGLLATLDQRYQQLTAGQFEGRWQSIAFDGIEVFRERIGQCVHQSGVAQQGYWTFATATELSAPAYWDGTSVEANTLICFEPGRAFELRTPRRAECVGFTIPESELGDFFDGQAGTHVEAPFNGRSLARVEEARRRPLLDLLLEAIRMAETQPARFDNAATHRHLRHGLLEALRHAFEVPEAIQPARDVGRAPAIARRAREFIVEHVDQPFTITDVCRAVGCSRRALQYAFERAFGVNPVAYVRAVRLDGVRRDLKHGDFTTTVQAAAARWGFWHLPRMAQVYAAMFGELPSATLRRAQASPAP